MRDSARTEQFFVKPENDINVVDMEMGVREINVLLRSGINTVGDLTLLTEKDLSQRSEERRGGKEGCWSGGGGG